MRRSERRTMSVTRTSLPRLLSDTGQKKTPEKKDVHRMSFQRPKGTVEYSVDSIDTLNSIALKFDTTPNELVQLNKLFSRAVIPGKVLYVPDPEYVSSAESSPSLSPISPLSPTSCEADLEKVTMDSDDVHRMDATLSPAHPLSRPAPVVSSTFEEEEAMTEKFLKINCKYITDGKGVVNGVLLVTPNNIMFDPHKTDLLVQDRGCEEYGIMCLLEEVMSAAMYTVVTDSRIKEFVPPELELLSSVPDPCQMNGVPRSNLEDVEQRACHAGNDSACTAPRSTEASLFEDVFTESELSPVQDNQGSSDELRLKSSVASSESVQTINQAVPDPPNPNPSQGAGQAPGRDETSRKGCTTEGSQLQKRQLSSGSRQKSVEAGDQGGALSTTSTSTDFPIICEGQAKSHTTSESQGSDTVAAAEQSSVQEEPPGMWKDGQAQESELGMEQLRKLWKSHTMQSASEQRDWDQQEAKTTNQDQSEEGAGKEYLSSLPPATTFPVPKEKRRQQSHKFLCLRVGKPMRKTFVSHASASMQQYAQRDRKHEYWFAVPHERSDHLYAFFVQWNADMYGEDMEGGGVSREPEFIVVKKNLEPETLFDKPPVPDITAKEWEVVSVAEYQQRTDALNSEDLRSLCRRLQITTKEVNSKHSPAIRTDLGSEIFWPNLSEPSDLLQTDQIEKLAKNLPPRTIGYHWSLAFSTNKHGMSIKTLYRAMKGLDTPVLMVIKDSDGHMFGALASEPFKVSDGFYGTGETFLFTFFPDFEVFKWTGDNMFFLKGDMDSLAFGGGGGEFGLWIDGDLYHGRSNPCKTFGNPMLSKKEDFFLQDVEIWTFQ